jgi:uncharacterized membrane protein YdjX (TVP38/TMEM64 family)
LILVGVLTGYLSFSKGIRLTPESFKSFIIALGAAGPVLYIAIFVVRPLFLIPSIALFIAGGLAFGPLLGPLYASIGAGMGGTVGFWIARKMGHDYVKSKLKLGTETLETTRFNFSVIFLLSLIPVMPVTVINYGAGLSPITFKRYILAHVMGITPRAFAYGFFGSTLLEIGSARFRAALIVLVLMMLVTIYIRRRNKASKTQVQPAGNSKAQPKNSKEF